MDPYADLLKRQRQLTPPPGAADQLEQRVMARLDDLPRERRRRLMLTGGASLGAALILLAAMLTTWPRAKRPAPPDFTESVVMLDGHTCIWLDIAEPNPATGHTHE